jgi:hypothetical protein
MTFDEFVSLVRRVRDAQRRYFSRKDNLEDCKALERQLDAEVKRHAEPLGLFGPLAPGPYDRDEGGTAR